jgi:LmbE family N-acetylglucosaminyl deacetylase
VTLVLLTAGERGNPAGAVDEGLKAVRLSEAQRAARILGVARLIQRDFGDGRLSEQREEVKAYLAELVRSTEPDLILSYDRDGLDGHPDHVVCAEVLVQLKQARAVTAALWCVTLPARVLRLLSVARQLAREPNLDKRRSPPTHRVFVGRSVVPKIRAWYAYRSQRGAIAKGLGRLLPVWFAVSMLQFEYFDEVG